MVSFRRSRRPGAHPVTHRVALLALAALAAGACSGTSAGDAAGTSNTAPPTSPPTSPPTGPGTALGDGFSVVGGTTLVGAPIPAGVAFLRRDEPIVDDGWTATMVVDEAEPLEVVEAYLGQAQAAGLTDRTGPGCAVDVEVLLCSAFARSPAEDPPRSLSATVVRGPRDDLVSNHVVVRYSTIDLYWEHGDEWWADDGEVHTREPTAWPPLPSVGEPLPTAGEMWHAVEVQEGSRLAGPPRLNLDDATGGVVAILEVTGDPEVVLQRYLDHFVALGLEAAPRRVLTIGEAVLTNAGGGQAGGDSYELSLVERPGRPPWLQLAGSHD